MGKNFFKSLFLKIPFFVSILLFLFSCNSILKNVDFKKENYKKADVIVILGYTIDKDGTPSFIQDNRVAAGVYLYKKGYADKIILTGGNPVKGKSEAELMKKYAVELGVKKRDIILEIKADSTWENAEHSIDICKKHGFKSFILVSDFLHLIIAVMKFQIFTIEQNYKIYWYSVDYKLLEKNKTITYPTKKEASKFEKMISKELREQIAKKHGFYFLKKYRPNKKVRR